MRHLAEWGFQSLGLLVVIVGWIGVVMASLLGVIWLIDVTLTQLLRFTGTFKLFIRFAWLEGNKKQQIKDDLAEEERRRKIPYVPPVYDEDDEESLADLIKESSPTPAGSGSDSDMLPGASNSQSCESGVEPRQGEGNRK